jgi:hypothetical protein
LAEGDLIECGDVEVLACSQVDDWVEQSWGEYEPAETEAGGQGLAGGAGVDDAVGVEGLERADGLVVVAELGVVVVVDHVAAGSACPGDRGRAALGPQQGARGELMRRTEHHRLGAGVREQVRLRAVLVHGERDDAQAGGGRYVAMPPVARVFHRDLRDALGVEHAGDQREPVGEAGAHDHELRIGHGPARTREIGGERLAQLGPAAGIAVAEARSRLVPETATQRIRPGGARKGREVRHARIEIEAGFGCG